MSDSAEGHWYVVHTKPFKESYAASALREQLGVEVYLAEVHRRLRGELKETPFFPSYIFVRADLEEVGISSINAMPGVVRLLQFGGRPQTIPDEVIQTIQEHINDLNASGGLPRHRFREGDKVVFRSGRFRDLEAVFMGSMAASARVTVLLYFLGRLNEVKVDVEELDPAHPEHPPKRERRSRGRNRPIRSQSKPPAHEG